MAEKGGNTSNWLLYLRAQHLPKFAKLQKLQTCRKGAVEFNCKFVH